MEYANGAQQPLLSLSASLKLMKTSNETIISTDCWEKLTGKRAGGRAGDGEGGPVGLPRYADGESGAQLERSDRRSSAGKLSRPWG